MPSNQNLKESSNLVVLELLDLKKMCRQRQPNTTRMKAPNRMGRGKGKGKEGTYVEELLPLELDELLVLLVGSALPDDAPGEVVPGEVVGLRVPCRLSL